MCPVIASAFVGTGAIPRGARCVLTALIAVISFLSATPGEPVEGNRLSAAVDALVVEALEGGPVAGMSVAVGRGGTVLMAKGYGFANAELQAPARADTAYHICSITKFITAAAILKLAQEGRLSLEDDVAGHVPGFSKGGRPIRIHHLLNHTSGLVSYTSTPGFDTKERLDLGHEEIVGPIRAAPSHFAPGEGWRYCNTGFYLLGMIIEKVTGHNYGDYVRKNLFEPLGMSDSWYGAVRPLIRNRAAGYEVDAGRLVNGPIMSWRAPFSGGAIVSTAVDLLKLTDGLARGRLLKPASVERMWSASRLADGTVIDYGLGTRLGTLSGHRMVGHTGSGGGFRNVLLHFPEDDLTIVVLTNTDAGNPTNLAVRIARTILQLAPDTRDELPLPKGSAAAFAGTYESEEGRVTVFEVDERVRFRERDDDVTGTPILYVGDGSFMVGGTVVRFLFKDGRGRASAVYVGGLFMDAQMRVH
jgi:CubicO group peptidase (beta-lactamase class C family)